MKKMMGYCVHALLVGSFVLFGCSNNKEAEEEPEKGAIEEMTDNAAKEIVNRIRTPMNKARSVKVRQENRMDDMEESLEEQ